MAEADVKLAMSSASGSDDELPEWVKAFSPIADKTKGKAHLKVEEPDHDDDEEAGPSTRPVSKEVQERSLQQSGPSTRQPPEAKQEGSVDEAATGRLDAVQESQVPDALHKGEITIMLPDRLPTTKILIELRASENNQTTDLAGDAGSVGRMVTSGKEGTGGTFQIDLKGVLYNTTILPLSGTALILNIGTSEGKVEAVMHDFVRLQEQFVMGMETLEGNAGDLYGSDEEEGYQVQDEGEAAAEGQAAGVGPTKKKKGASKKPTAGKSLAKGSLGVKGGVKKARKPAAEKKAAKATKGSGKATIAGAKQAKATPAAKPKAGSKGKPAGATKAKAAGKPRSAKKAKGSDSSGEEELESDDVDMEDGSDDEDYSG